MFLQRAMQIEEEWGCLQHRKAGTEKVRRTV